MFNVAVNKCHAHRRRERLCLLLLQQRPGLEKGMGDKGATEEAGGSAGEGRGLPGPCLRQQDRAPVPPPHSPSCRPPLVPPMPPSPSSAVPGSPQASSASPALPALRRRSLSGWFTGGGLLLPLGAECGRCSPNVILSPGLLERCSYFRRKCQLQATFCPPMVIDALSHQIFLKIFVTCGGGVDPPLAKRGSD